jgi:hypothetical protein
MPSDNGNAIGSHQLREMRLLLRLSNNQVKYILVWLLNAEQSATVQLQWQCFKAHSDALRMGFESYENEITLTSVPAAAPI